MYDKITETILIFVRGLLMGSVETIPGVSAGTIALITGIYEKLVHAIGKIKFSFAKPLIKGNFSEFKKNFFDEIEFQLFIPVLLGMGIAVLAFSNIVKFLMNTYPAFTFAFFLGLILASAYVLYRRIVHFSPKMLILTIVGFVLSFIFVGINPIAADHSLLIIFFSGLVAICAMLLPGLSGAFVLLLIGQYNHMLNALTTFSWADIITFCVGALVGMLGFSKFLDYLLQNYEEVTMALLIGVMIGTLRLPYNEVATSLTGSQFEIPICIIIAIFGFALIVLLEMKFKQIE
jgi:putative membrane protein